MSGGHLPQHTSNEKYAESMMNMALLDPPRWGWPAVGGVTDLLTPHERARRKETKKAYALKNKIKRKRGRPPSSSLKSPPAENSVAAHPTAGEQKAAGAATPSVAALPPPIAADATPKTADSKQQPSSTTDTNGSKDRVQKDNLQPPEEEDSKPAAKPSTSESHPPTANGDLNEIAGENKAVSSKQSSAEAKPKPTKNDAKDAAMTEATLQPQTSTVDSEAPRTSTTAKFKEAATGPKPDDSETAKEQRQQLEIEDGVLKIRALNDDGDLDIYAYHRGREGMEPRDANTGELLCDVEQTDTNFKWDEPKLGLQVTISFPLTDSESTTTNSNDVPMFEDTIYWNLGDPETPTPIAFATATAEQFGLTFGQTQDLAVSVQQQLFNHIKDHCGYPEPVAMSDGAGLDRSQLPPPTVCHMYGGVGGIVKPGTFCANASAPSRSKSKKHSYSAHGSSSRRSAANSEDTGRERSRQAPIEYYADDEPAEDNYVEEIKKRMVEFSREDVSRKCEEAGMPNGQLNMQQNYVCHICHKRHNLVGKFACGFQSHSYCKTHLQNRLGLSVEGVNDDLSFDHCPICAVTCLCSKCGRRRDALAIQLKRKSQQQGVDASSTVFDDMFSCLTKPGAAVRISKQAAAEAKKRETTKPKPKPAATSSATEGGQGSVSVSQEKPKPASRTKASRKPSIRAEPTEESVASAPAGSKPPQNHFPREIRNGVDVDPGSAIDYRTVYTAEGHYVKDLAALPRPKHKGTEHKGNEPAVAEDGNVDYCYNCRSGGSLLCCDYCPRAFHPKCLEDDENDESGGTWECPVCKRSKKDLPEYILTGSESQSKICAAYSDLKVNSDDDLTQLTVLSKIHEMLVKLMQTDFGPVFAVPVDINVVPGYDKFIKRPMDLGTIASKLLDGGYKKFFEKESSWADVHLAVLKDIELVWHNCFTFNYEGSSYYKMAEDLRRRMLVMRSRSLDNDLPDAVKHKLDDYVRTSRKERGKIPIPAQLDGRPKSRYKIMVAGTKIGRSTKVAVLDPASGMVVKIYLTIKGAQKAAEDLIKRGYKSEIKVNDTSLKALIKRSTDDPSATLFGHRWLELEKLHNGQVRFNPREGKPAATTIFELTDGQASHTFLSLDEAITHRLSRDKPKKELRNALEQLREGGEGINIFGLQWRRRKLVVNGKALHKDVVLAPFWENNGDKAEKELKEPIPAGTLVTKEDRIIGRITGRFESVEAAFEDWVFACRSSATIPPNEISESSFYTHYLNGDRNVDGTIWKIVGPNDDAEEEEEKSVDGDSQIAPSIACETTTSQSPTLVSNEEEKALSVVVETSSEAPACDATSMDVVEASVENLPAQSINTQTANGSDVKAALMAPVVNGVKKRERSEDDALVPNKKLRGVEEEIAL